MLNGIAPIFLFTFYKQVPSVGETPTGVKIVDNFLSSIAMPPIPLYLDEKLTGIYVDTRSKNIDLETTIEAKKDASEPSISQRPINSSVTIELIANADSLGLTVLSAMMDVILPMVTSKDYSITYLDGAVTVFNGQLNSFSITQSTDNTLYRISINLSQTTKETTVIPKNPLVERSTGALPL